MFEVVQNSRQIFPAFMEELERLLAVFFEDLLDADGGQLLVAGVVDLADEID